MFPWASRSNEVLSVRRRRLRGVAGEGRNSSRGRRRCSVAPALTRALVFSSRGRFLLPCQVRPLQFSAPSYEYGILVWSGEFVSRPRLDALLPTRSDHVRALSVSRWGIILLLVLVDLCYVLL